MFKLLFQFVAVSSVFLLSLNDCFPTKEIEDDEVIVRENSVENSEIGFASNFLKLNLVLSPNS